jgi:hypothetical protein
MEELIQMLLNIIQVEHDSMNSAWICSNIRHEVNICIEIHLKIKLA